jgi:hypothetical protein
MARPTKASIRFRDDLDALYAAVILLENGSTPERVSEKVWETWGISISPAAVVDWHRFWTQFASERTTWGENLLETRTESDLRV